MNSVRWGGGWGEPPNIDGTSKSSSTCLVTRDMEVVVVRGWGGG